MTTSLSHITHCVHYLAICCSATSGSIQLRDYSCQAGDYYRSYYRTTLEFYHKTTTTPKKTDEVVDVEQETTATAPTRLPTLRAPKVQILGDWHDVKDYLIDNLVKSHTHYDYKEASRAMGAYYSTFSELRLPVATTGESEDSESEEELQSMIQTRNLWSPYHWSTTLDTNPARTYYMILEQEGLKKWEESGRNDVLLSSWKSTTSKVYQHLHHFEHPLQALNYALSLVANSMSTTVVPLNEQLHLVALNLYPEVVLQRNLLHYYKRDGSTYLELESHNDALRDMNNFATPTVIISGCTYNYIVQMLTSHFYENHLVDTTVISGPDYMDITSVKNMYTRNYDKTMAFLQKVKPDYIPVALGDTTDDTTIATASSSQKKGERTTTISSDYDLEIVVKHVKRA